MVNRDSSKILVIDDDQDILKLIHAILSPAGYSIHLAKDGEDALAIADSHGPIDLLLTDVVMPGMGGEEVAHLFKKNHPFASVLFMSAYLQPAVEKFEDTHGKAYFILKPFSAKKLHGMVKRILSR